MYTSWGQRADRPAKIKNPPDLNSIRTMRRNRRHAQARRRKKAAT